MKDFKFSEEDLINIFDFLSRLVEAGNKLDMNELQVMVFLPYLFTNTAAREYRSNSSGDRTDGLVYWPETVQHFLCTCAKDSPISVATENLESIRKMRTKPKTHTLIAL